MCSPFFPDRMYRTLQVRHTKQPPQRWCFFLLLHQRNSPVGTRSRPRERFPVNQQENDMHGSCNILDAIVGVKDRHGSSRHALVHNFSASTGKPWSGWVHRHGRAPYQSTKDAASPIAFGEWWEFGDAPTHRLSCDGPFTFDWCLHGVSSHLISLALQDPRGTWAPVHRKEVPIHESSFFALARSPSVCLQQRLGVS